MTQYTVSRQRREDGEVVGIPSSHLLHPFPFLLDKALDIEGRRETGVADERNGHRRGIWVGGWENSGLELG